MRKLTFQRDQLYKEVWSTPKNKLTKKYGISYHRLTKVCEDLNIPTPPLGYWKKLKHNKSVKKTPLPQGGQDSYVLKKRDSINTDINELLPKKVKPITVKRYLRAPHPLVKATHNHLKKREVDRYKRLKAIGEGYLDLSVGPDNLKRALRIMDAVIGELERQNFNIETEYNYKRSNLFVSIDKVKLYIRIREKSYRVTNEPDESGGYSWEHPKFEYFPDGKLRLQIAVTHSADPEKVIRDTKTKTLESQLDNFFPYLFHVARKRKKHLDELEARHRRWEKQRHLNAQVSKQNNAELKQRELLTERAEAFTKTRYMYDFIDQIEKMGSQRDLNIDQKYALKGWVHWARLVADLKNPLNQALNDILDVKKVNR